MPLNRPLHAMFRVKVTEQMAKRMLKWLEIQGIITYDDTFTIDDLMRIANPKKGKKSDNSLQSKTP